MSAVKLEDKPSKEANKKICHFKQAVYVKKFCNLLFMHYCRLPFHHILLPWWWELWRAGENYKHSR